MIALVVPGGVDPPGGDRIIPFVHHLVGALAARHDVLVIAVGHDPEPGEWDLLGARVVNVPIGSHSKADIARVLVQVPRAIARHGRPTVVHGLWANLPGLTAAAAATRFRAPCVVSVCGGELAAVPAIDYGGGLRRGTRQLALAALRRADAVTVATEWMVHHVTAAGGNVTDVVPLGADLTIFSAGTPEHSDDATSATTVDTPDVTPTDPHRFVHVAGLNRVKDQDLLLRAFAILAAADPRRTLHIVGGDHLDGHHRSLAADLGISHRVTFAGHVAHEHLAAGIRGAALHLLTSLHDAGPISVLEAAACGVPTVGTTVGHVADLAALPEPGAVAVPERNPAAFAAAVESVLADESRRVALASRARTWAERHDAAFTADTFGALYRRLTHQP